MKNTAAENEEEIEALLKGYLPAEEGYAKRVKEAMNYKRSGRRKATAAHADAGKLPAVWRRKESW